MLASRSPRHAEAEPKVRSVSEVVVCSVALAVHLRATSVVRPALGQGAWYNVWPGAPLKKHRKPHEPPFLSQRGCCACSPDGTSHCCTPACDGRPPVLGMVARSWPLSSRLLCVFARWDVTLLHAGVQQCDVPSGEHAQQPQRQRRAAVRIALPCQAHAPHHNLNRNWKPTGQLVSNYGFKF